MKVLDTKNGKTAPKMLQMKPMQLGMQLFSSQDLTKGRYAKSLLDPHSRGVYVANQNPGLLVRRMYDFDIGANDINQ